ncbi:MAG: UDP-N-acetylmuramate:L-alanyl-gamma-D-glutamyl-meso-diaminopimelate ligase [Gammaproteobacteria bacterium]|nr:UDP-N-acetylmuramate:L-alanyl-gamma-D-glutamyl-meso-diaminopimelate ligase [Gammaproteobacteria bacterium]
MHVHVLGICGTFMGGIAALAQAAGHRVTGSDRNVYPPMSTQLEALGIRLIEGYEPDQLALAPDVVVVGNVMSRGNPLIERLLESGIPYTSGPQWLAEHVLRGRWTLAVAGTHGKTTTTSMLAFILHHAGQDPGFLIGGVPVDFPSSARLGTGRHFVVEADEYDTAFFDKRAKFVHYRPRTAILNNLEYDHADIYPDVASIQRQFHHLVRTVPGNGLIVANGADQRLDEVLAQGCWTPRESFAHEGGVDWSARLLAADGSEFEVMFRGERQGRVRWGMIGGHNVDNALAAIAAARHAGVPVAAAVEALSVFGGIKRRMELRGTVAGVTVYDDFAHHPTAIATTVAGLRHRVGSARIVAVLEPRSNTMKLGVHRDEIAHSLAAADRVWFYRPADLGWDLAPVAGLLGPRASVATDLDGLVAALANESLPGDHVLVMSNGGFGGLHGRLLEALAKREATREDS